MLKKNLNWYVPDPDFSKEKFAKDFRENGYVIRKNVLPQDFIAKCKSELKIAINEEVKYMGTEDYSFFGYVLVNAKYGGTFVDIFNNEKITNSINAILGDSCVLYSYTSSSMPPGKGNDSSHIHVDSPIFIEDYILRMGVLIPLVDFNEGNGATTYLPGSHKKEQQPSEEYYERNSKLLNLNAGDAWFFHTRLWHSGGVNKSKEWRHALTMNVSRPWIKQRVDIPGVMKDFDLSKMSEVAKQKLGFYAQVPTSYDEYFAPPEKRTFKQSNI